MPLTVPKKRKKVLSFGPLFGEKLMCSVVATASVRCQFAALATIELFALPLERSLSRAFGLGAGDRWRWRRSPGWPLCLLGL
jgi:hypothetical protein